MSGVDADQWLCVSTLTSSCCLLLFVVLLVVVVVVVAAVRFFQMVSSVDSCFVWD